MPYFRDGWSRAGWGFTTANRGTYLWLTNTKNISWEIEGGAETHPCSLCMNDTSIALKRSATSAKHFSAMEVLCIHSLQRWVSTTTFISQLIFENYYYYCEAIPQILHTSDRWCTDRWYRSSTSYGSLPLWDVVLDLCKYRSHPGNMS